MNTRDSSKLLVYKNEQIVDSQFNQLHEFLEQNDLLIFNNAKVIPARLFFKRETGAQIETLLLEPIHPANYEEMFKSFKSVRWKCMIGNLRKWRQNEVLNFYHNNIDLQAKLISKEERIVEFSWNQSVAFSQILQQTGELPLPPYLNRDVEDNDYRDYQTYYADIEGSVAAPTAGLHFTEKGLARLVQNKIDQSYLTLHVGAGTFLPVKHENVLDHEMHTEHFEIDLVTLKGLVHTKRRIAVGTTSLRVLESLYWLGAKINATERCHVDKLEPYSSDCTLSYEECILQIISHLEALNKTKLIGSTSIMILPTYKLKSISALITNFHLPESTLLMLISAVVGENWKKIYQHAISNNYRFLSYGDSSLLFVK